MTNLAALKACLEFGTLVPQRIIALPEEQGYHIIWPDGVCAELTPEGEFHPLLPTQVHGGYSVL